MAERLNRSVDPTAVIIPKGGLSSYAKGWEELADEEADFALLEILKSKIKPEIRVFVMDCGINEKCFAEKATDFLNEMISLEKYLVAEDIKEQRYKRAPG